MDLFESYYSSALGFGAERKSDCLALAFPAKPGLATIFLASVFVFHCLAPLTSLF